MMPMFRVLSKGNNRATWHYLNYHR